MQIKEEKWRPIVGYEEFYEVSDNGRVRSKIKNTRIRDKESGIMRQKYDTKGYLRVNLTKDGKRKAWLVSRLVAMVFVANPKNYKIVGHDDDVKTNNNAGNLYWTTQLENNHHNGKMERFQKMHNEKIKEIASKLSIAVISKNIYTGEEKIFPSMQETQAHGFCPAKVSTCCSGKRKTHRNHEWRKLDAK